MIEHEVRGRCAVADAARAIRDDEHCCLTAREDVRSILARRRRDRVETKNDTGSAIGMVRTREVVACSRVRRALKAVADPAKAPQMQAYMKSEMPYHGVSSPVLAAVCREVFADYAPADAKTGARRCARALARRAVS